MILSVMLVLGVISTGMMTAMAIQPFEVPFGFQRLIPALTAEEIDKGTYNLGQIEYNTPTVFGFEPIELSGTAVEAGYSLKEIISLSDSKQSNLITRTDGTSFDVMPYIPQPGKYRIWFMLMLYKGEDFVRSTTLEYTFEVVTAMVDTLSVQVSMPIIGDTPNGEARPVGDGTTVTTVEWSYFDEDTYGYYAMPDTMCFEEGKTYQVVVGLIPDNGFVFPASSEDLSVLVNGKQGSIVYEYSKNLAYVSYQFTPIQVVYGDVDQNGQIAAADALTILKGVVGKTQLTEQQRTAADVDANGEIAATDALLVLKKVVGKIDRFPVEG